jgi:alpha/beta superfamily hydrolase
VPRGAALVCHAHPLHGGSMHTKAVYRTARGLAADDFAVLRFNFRGVGRSAGVFDAGRGEIDDARAAFDWLAAHGGSGPRLLGGFSFGSSMALRLAARLLAETPHAPPVQALLAIGIPLTLDAFDFLETLDLPVLLVVGDRDPFCPLADLQDLAGRLGARAHVHVLPGAGHLLTDRLDELQEAVRGFVARVVPAGPERPAGR